MFYKPSLKPYEHNSRAEQMKFIKNYGDYLKKKKFKQYVDTGLQVSNTACTCR